MEEQTKICIIGLGYVGLPLFKIVSQHFKCCGIDCNNTLIQNIKSQRIGSDDSVLTSNWKEVTDCNVFIVCVPTPINENKKPDLNSLRSVCESLGALLKQSDLVIFESTVYPGATEEFCVPILEHYSKLILNEDFYVGYSPERINVGDSEHTIDQVPKIISGSNKNTLEKIYLIYRTFLGDNVVLAPSIKVAEAAKMYENIQRDVLIALANEYADYCRKEGINIDDVTRCASTKWNFSNVRPGLVGGHCISVDPYYLMAKADNMDVELSIINAARNVNESEPIKIAVRIIDILKSKGIEVNRAKVLILGFTYKANVPDIRNTKTFDVLTYLKNMGCMVDCLDPLANPEAVHSEYGIELLNHIEHLTPEYDLVVELVPHSIFEQEVYQLLTPIKLKDLV